MEWLIEKIEKYSWYIIVFCIGFLFAFSVILPVCNRRINRANSEAAVARIELQRAREEVEKAGDTISNIRRIQSELTEGLGDNNRELHSVIERLTFIRDKVQDIEDELDNYVNSSGGNISLHRD